MAPTLMILVVLLDCLRVLKIRELIDKPLYRHLRKKKVCDAHKTQNIDSPVTLG